MNEKVIINARKYDGIVHRSWECNLIQQNEDSLVFVGVFNDEITHSDLGIIRPGTISYEYYWLNRWYNVFRFHEPDGAFRNFYCNVNTPPKFESGVLNYIDLEIDVLISKNFEIAILDVDEYRINSKKYAYSAEVKENVESSVSELIFLAENRLFPFDFLEL